MLLAGPEVVRQVIALGFQGVVVLVFDLPAGAPGFYEGGDIAGRDRVVADPGVVIQDLAVRAGGAVSSHQLTSKTSSLSSRSHVFHAVLEVRPGALVREPAHQFPQVADQVAKHQVRFVLSKWMCQCCRLVVCGPARLLYRSGGILSSSYAADLSK